MRVFQYNFVVKNGNWNKNGLFKKMEWLLNGILLT